MEGRRKFNHPSDKTKSDRPPRSSVTVSITYILPVPFIRILQKNTVINVPAFAIGAKWDIRYERINVKYRTSRDFLYIPHPAITESKTSSHVVNG